MFTGLIEEKGKVIRIESASGGLKLSVEARVVAEGTKVGDSIAINGACLTVIEAGTSSLRFDAVRETIERTTIGRLRPGNPVNLERPMKAGSRFGGHMVLGHVDGVGTIREIRKSGNETIFRFEAPPEIMQYVVEKGSIAVDGISLTIADLGPGSFAVAVIPHTLSSTTLGDSSVGGSVNLETDIIGKYVYKFTSKIASSSDELLIRKLSEGGFME